MEVCEMGYRSLLSHVGTGGNNANIFSASVALADMFDASVIGIAGAQLTPPFTEVPVADMMQYEREAAEKALGQAEQEFRAAFRGKATQLSWRTLCDYTPVTNFVIRQARAADLVITSPQTASFLTRMDEANVGPLVLQAGRPVLIVPKDHKGLTLGKVVVAWKDTREARRAASDALPLLKKAREVVVVEVCDPAEARTAGSSVADVVQWLKGHGVTARAAVEACEDEDLDGLYRFLKRENCDLVVAGAYGHTRLREWIFGGVTMDLLLPAGHCVLLSH
jgi:nucleotide-binding universal stress UspA family protein